MAKKDLINAKRIKFNEFYTRLNDIELELKHYKEQFKNKVVFCNCDDPYESNFFKYFAMNFNQLGLKKLIATCYDNSPVAYTQFAFLGVNENKVYPNKNRHAYKIEINEVTDLNHDGAVDLSDVKLLLQNKKNTLVHLQCDGDFRSEECIELLKQADIVVTNPPFSLFREYVAQLVEYNKKFIIIGNPNAVSYKEIFSLIKDNKLWFGYK
ncbi:MAG: modification methylase, partial [Eubacteriales bacterium]|nr:modification methylase [Eubacteriales bacterium]